MKARICQEEDIVWLDGIEGWSASEKASSVHAALEVVMISLGEESCYDYLVGVSSLAFRMQIGGLCPSSPHPGCGYNCIDRSVNALPWNLAGYSLDDDSKENQEKINEIIIQSINKGIPVITGEEDDGLIIGYKKRNTEFLGLHPWQEDGKRPYLISSLKDICWGIGVITDRKTEVNDKATLAIDSLRQAVEMARTKKSAHYHLGFEAWKQYIHLLKEIHKNKKRIKDKDIIGNAWIYECLVQYRDVAAKYLLLIEDHIPETARKHLRKASVLYKEISTGILRYEKERAVKVTGEYNSLKKTTIWTREMCDDQVKRLEKAQPLEEQAINEIEKTLSSVS